MFLFLIETPRLLIWVTSGLTAFENESRLLLSLAVFKYSTRITE